jgi:membrane associated rhomboid family serine protease
MYPVVKNIIIINVLLLFATYVFKSQFGIDLVRILGLHYFKSDYFQPYQFVTHMFMHGGFAHIFFNMFALWMFGRILESVWGSKRFLIYYMVTGLGAAALHTLVNHFTINSMIDTANTIANTPSPGLFREFVSDHVGGVRPEIKEFISRWTDNPNNQQMADQAVHYVRNIVNRQINIPTVGASGAVFGVLLAFGMLFPNTRLLLLFPPIPIKAKYFVIFYGILELYLGITQPGSSIAHFAHIGGMLFGFFLVKYWDKNRKTFY